MKPRFLELAQADLDGDTAVVETLTQYPEDWAEALGQMKHAAEEEIIARRAEAGIMAPPARRDDSSPYARSYYASRHEFRQWYDGHVAYIKRVESRMQHAKALGARARQAQQRERSALRIEQRLWRVEELLGISEHQEWTTYHERLLRVERLLADRLPAEGEERA